MSPQDDYVIVTDVFREDCNRYGFPTDDVDAVKTALTLDPQQGNSIKFAITGELKFTCAELRVMPWTYLRSGTWTKAHILFVHVPDTWPVYLLRLEIDDAHDPSGPFSDPHYWPRWAEILGELAEITLRTWT